MQKVLELVQKPGFKVVLLLVVLTMVGVGIVGIYTTQVPPEQPILFPHNRHVALQVQCLYCHPGAWRQASAGLPTVQKCWACHGQLKKYYDPAVPVDNWPAELQKLHDYATTNTPIQWVPVYQVPDFVHFNHRPHIAKGVACETCHGDMANKTIATVEETVNMGWCIKCHTEKSANDPALREKLLDCGTCHY